MRIIFMGTPDFAAFSLRKMLENGENIVAVVTAPDRPAGRGQILTKPPVKLVAEEFGLEILQPEALNDNNFRETILKLNPDLQIVIAFRILPECVWAIPKLGTVNLHASLLPKYRGAAPINWAIINGESETGLTTFFINNGVDVGDLIMQKKITINENDNYSRLYEKMKICGAGVIMDTISSIRNHDYSCIKQDFSSNYSKAPKIFKPDCEINWDQDSKNIRNFVRGMTLVPGAFTYINDIYYKICDVDIADDKFVLSPGQLHVDYNLREIYVGTKSGSVLLKTIQREGKKIMDAKIFLLGNKI